MYFLPTQPTCRSSVQISHPTSMFMQRQKEDKMTVDDDCPLQGDASSIRDLQSFAIKKYLLANVAEFRELDDLREKGWKNPAGDKFFAKQRFTADNATEKMARTFYNMMKRIGQQMQQFSGSLAIPKTGSAHQPKVLDLCMAPGGFLATAMSLNPDARARAFSLPVSEGGHEVFLPQSPNVRVELLDVTMFAADMGMDMAEIPRDHPDAMNFLPRQFEPGENYDLVICDGHVLRTQVRAPYREARDREARRLTTTQLALSLEHMKSGGTLIALLHKVDVFDTFSFIYQFNKFSSVKLFKSTRGHVTRSSFYMIATDIQPQHPDAVLAVKTWKETWRVATFGTDDEYGKVAFGGSSLDVTEMLDEFGPKYIQLTRKVCEIQTRALAKASFVK